MAPEETNEITEDTDYHLPSYEQLEQAGRKYLATRDEVVHPFID